MNENKKNKSIIASDVGKDYKKYIFPSLLVFFLVILAFSNYIYLSIEGNNIAEHLNDETVHLVKSYYYHTEYLRGNWSSIIFQDRLISTFPPLVYLDTLVFYILFGKSKIISIASFLVFYLILIFSTYFTGSLLFNRDTGFLAGLAVPAPPLVALSSHLYILDFPLAAMVALSIFLLFKSEFFRQKKWTILFFISLGLACLTKPSAMQYLAAPFILVFLFFAWAQLKDPGTRWKFLSSFFSLMIISVLCFYLANSQPFKESIQKLIKFPRGDFFLPYVLFIFIFIAGIIIVSILKLDEGTKNFSAGFLIFLIVIWHYYGMHLFEIYNYMQHSAIIGHINERRHILESLRQYMDFFQGRFLTLFLIIGLLAFPFLKKTREQKILLFGFIVSTLVIFFTPVANTRYYVPLAVYSALFACYWIPKIRFSWIRCPLAVIFILICFFGCFSWFVGYNYDKVANKEIRDLVFKYIHPPPHTDKPIFAEMIKIMKDNIIPDNTCIVYYKTCKLRSPFRPWVEPIFFDLTISRELDSNIRKYGTLPWKNYENERFYLQVMPINVGQSGNPSRVIVIYTCPPGFQFESLEKKLYEYRDKSTEEYNLALPGESLMKILVIDSKGKSDEIINEFYELEPENFGGKMNYMK